MLADLDQKEYRWAEADEHLRHASEQFADQGDQAGVAEALRLRGFGSLFRRDYDAARSLLEEARAGFEVAGDRRGAAWALQNLAWCEFYTGRTAEAESLLRGAIEEFTELGDRGGLGWATGLLAWTRLQQGDRVQAQEIGDKVLADIRGGGDRWAVGVMLTLAALTRLWGGKPQEAVGRAEEAYELCNDLGDIFLRLQATGVLGRSLVHAGRVEEGLARLEEAVSVLGNDPSASDQVYFLMTMLGVAVRLGDVALASQVREEMRRAGIADDELYGEGEVSLALLTLQEGDPEGALASLVLEGAVEQDGYRHAATALALAAAGRDEDALAAAAALLGAEGPTYLDRLDAASRRRLPWLAATTPTRRDRCSPTPRPRSRQPRIGWPPRSCCWPRPAWPERSAQMTLSTSVLTPARRSAPSASRPTAGAAPSTAQPGCDRPPRRASACTGQRRSRQAEKRKPRPAWLGTQFRPAAW